MENLDTNIDPNVPESRDEIAAWVKAVGDKAESQGLEVKSSLEFSKSERKKSFAKITKFILASSNRDQNQALRDYRGYGVMLIGVTHHKVLGLENIPEQHEFEEATRGYFGSAVPSYHFEHHVFEGKNILFVIVDPPTNGKEIYICSKEYQPQEKNSGDQLRDGAIYYRESTQTKEAGAVQIRDIINRLLGGNITVDMKASSFYRVSCIDTEVLEYLYHEPKKKYAESLERMIEDEKNKKDPKSYYYNNYETPFLPFSWWGVSEALENYKVRLKECFEGLLKKNLPPTILSIKNDGTKALKNPRIEYSFSNDIYLVNLDGVEKLKSYDIFPFLPIPEREYFDFEPGRPILPPEEPHLSSRFSKGSKPGVIVWKPGPVNPGEIITSGEDNTGIFMVGNNDTLVIRYSITDSNLQRPINGEIYADKVELKNITDLLKVVTFPECIKTSIPF
ncbi:RNA-binding domain-containing protein [uncultured Rothia sp.]|uniref:RNA-binding domain-containing protein n=1 Tax=uncultured Rothia sp. TaxID=316088 RepID=UPI0028DAF831|nr:RNA-binding domain-containing protein [uncultured Rothia sp.]